MEISSTASRPPKPVRSAESPRYWAGPGCAGSCVAGAPAGSAGAVGGAAGVTVWFSGRASCPVGAASVTEISLDCSLTCVTT